MARRRILRGNRDGLSILDQWAAKKRQEGKRWRYRVWDPTVGRYASACFSDDLQLDAKRTTPGCAAGDQWAKGKTARFQLGLDSAQKVTLRQAGEAFLVRCEALGRSPHHLRAVRWTIERASEAGIDDLGSPDVPRRVQRWLSKVTACRPRQRRPTPASPRLKNLHINILRSIGNFAVRQGSLIKNPFLLVDRFPEARRDRAVYSIQDLREITSEKHRNHAWWLFAVLAAYTGLRSETIRKLTWSMVDWDSNRLRVPAAITKTNSDVRVPIQPELRVILGENPRIGNVPILAWEISQMDSNRANELTQDYLRDIGIAPNGRSVHTFRHTVAALLTATGLSHFLVMDAVGHSSTQTSKHYSRGADEFREQVRREGWPEGEFFLRRAPLSQARER